MRTLALQSSLVAALALGAVSGPPVSDEGQTNSSAEITIPVLLNDPSGTVLLGIDDGAGGVTTGPFTLPSGAVVTKVGDAISYDPDGFIGNDSFTYVTNCGDGTPEETASVIVAVTPATPLVTNKPRPDRDSTPCGTPIRLDVLRNDPEGSQITGIIDSSGVFSRFDTAGTVVALPSGATVTYVARSVFSGSVGLDSILYTPPITCPLDDSFEYTTQGGRATVSVTVDDTAAPPDAQNGPPVDIDDTTPLDTPILIDVLAANPPGTELLGVNDFFILGPGLGPTRTLGNVQIRGNKIRYSPDTNLQSTGDIDRFTYITNGGTGTVTITIGEAAGTSRTGMVTLINDTGFTVEFRIASTNPAQNFADCLNLRPASTIDVGAGDTVMTIEPFTGNPPLCVILGQGTGATVVTFQASVSGITPSLCSPPPMLVVESNCLVNESPGGVTVTVSELIGDCTSIGGTTITDQLTGLQMTCAAN